MTQELAAELRIFTGIHAGARAALAVGSYVLGADSACDFVLCDEGVAGRHAELRICDAEWVLHPLSEHGATTGDLRLKAGEGVAIGSVMIAIDAPQAPWQMTGPVAAPASSSALESQRSPHETVTPVPQIVEPEVESQPSAQRNPGRPVLFSLAAAGLLVGLLWVRMLPGSEVPSEPIAPPVEVSSEAQIRAIIDSLNLATRAQLERRPDGQLVVRAELLGEDEYENLAIALSRVNPRPEFKIVDEQDLVREVLDFLQLRSATLSADHLGSGRFRIKGTITGESERDALMQALKTEFPVRFFESELLIQDVVVTQFLDELISNGATSVSGEWLEGSFTVSAKVSGVDPRHWEQDLLKTEARFGKQFPFLIHTEFDDKGEVNLPFRIIGVAGGQAPFVVLSDQSKVLIGGNIQGWHLSEIDGSQVVFDGPRRIALKR